MQQTTPTLFSQLTWDTSWCLELHLDSRIALPSGIKTFRAFVTIKRGRIDARRVSKVTRSGSHQGYPCFVSICGGGPLMLRIIEVPLRRRISSLRGRQSKCRRRVLGCEQHGKQYDSHWPPSCPTKLCCCVCIG